MSTYREALYAARMGATVKRDGRAVRYLTPDEAEPILLERMPRRRIGENGEVEIHAPVGFDVRKLGLFEVADNYGELPKPVEHAPVGDDLEASNWELPEGFELPVAFRPPPPPAFDVVVEATFDAATDAAEAPAGEPLVDTLADVQKLLGLQPEVVRQLAETAGPFVRSMFGNPPPPPPEPAEPPELHVKTFRWIDSVTFNDDMSEWLSEMTAVLREHGDNKKVKLHGSSLKTDSIEVSYSLEE